MNKPLSREERHAKAVELVSKLGPKPVLVWIDKLYLEVEPAYQRELSQKRSQALITRIAENWNWVNAAVLIVSKSRDTKADISGKNRGIIIDGQHRREAALRRVDIPELPCLLVDAHSVEERAKAFVSHNRDRVTLNFLALFHADVAAGNQRARWVVEACGLAGITIPRSPKTTHMLKPDETMAVGAMAEIVSKLGRDTLVSVLGTIKAAYPEKGGQIRSQLVKATASMISMGLAPAAISTALAATDCEQIDTKARTEERVPGRSLTQAFAEVVAKSCGTTTVRPPAVRGRRRRGAGIKRSTPFHFDRSQPSKPVQPAKPIVGKDAVKVRRFEAGDMMALVTRALESKGHKLERHRGSRPFKLDGKPVTYEQVLSKADEIRAVQGLLPLRQQKKA